MKCNDDSLSFSISRPSVMFTKKVFITVANSFSSVIGRLFSFNINLFEFKPLLCC